MQAEHWVAPQDSWALEGVGCPGAGVLGDGHGGSGEHCCDCGCGRGCAGSRWSAGRTTPAGSLNGSGLKTGDRGRALRRGNAADSRMGAWAWPRLYVLLLYLTNRVCCHLVRAWTWLGKTQDEKIRHPVVAFVSPVGCRVTSYPPWLCEQKRSASVGAYFQARSPGSSWKDLGHH